MSLSGSLNERRHPFFDGSLKCAIKSGWGDTAARSTRIRDANRVSLLAARKRAPCVVSSSARAITHSVTWLTQRTSLTRKRNTVHERKKQTSPSFGSTGRADSCAVTHASKPLAYVIKGARIELCRCSLVQTKSPVREEHTVKISYRKLLSNCRSVEFAEFLESIIFLRFYKLTNDWLI